MEGCDIKEDKKFTIINKLHKDIFDSCRHYYDENNERDLIITASNDSHVKVIEFYKEESEIIIDLNFERQDKLIIYTAFILNDKILIPVSNMNTIGFYNFKGKYISEIRDVGFILDLNIYTDTENNHNYILIANSEIITTYNIENSSFRKFIPIMTPEEKQNYEFNEPCVIKREKTTLIMGASFAHPYFFIWDFFNGDLIQKIITSSGISDICLLNDFYVFASMVDSKDKNLVLIDIDKGEIVKQYQEDINNSYSGIKVLNCVDEKYLVTSNMNGELDLYTY